MHLPPPRTTHSAPPVPHHYQALRLPVRSIQLDDWWYVGSEPDSHDHMCVKELAPDPDLFPRGLPALPEGISYHLYGDYTMPFTLSYMVSVTLINLSNLNATLDPSHDPNPSPGHGN